MPPRQCRYCYESTPPLITPCNCDGSVKYIHKSCILRWATIDGRLDHSKLICSLCTTPYDIPRIQLERFFTGTYAVDLLLYNSAGVSVLINYFSILYGVHVGQGISERLMAGQFYIYLLYCILYGMYVRIHNIELYLSIYKERHAYIYPLIQLYSCYSGMTERIVLMSVTALLAQYLMWREHVKTLLLVNEALVKND